MTAVPFPDRLELTADHRRQVYRDAETGTEYIIELATYPEHVNAWRVEARTRTEPSSYRVHPLGYFMTAGDARRAVLRDLEG